MVKEKALEIDMCAGSELRDSQGETLSVEGADISEMQAGRGRFNDNHGKGFFNSIGRVTEAKKIFKAEDCETDRHKYYWEQVKAPYIYVKGFLYNDEDHPNAKAAAAILRNIHKSDCPLKIKASVEGGVISRGLRDSSRLERTKIHSIAITFTPANKATLVEPITISKSLSSVQHEIDQELIKSVMHLAKKDEEIPSFRHVQRNAQANRIISNIEKIQELARATGINIQIEETDTETLIKNAIENKVLNNVQKINELMKQFQPNKLFGDVQAKRQVGAKYNVARNPDAPTSVKDYTPMPAVASGGGQSAKPSGVLTTPEKLGEKQGVVPVQSATQVKTTNTFKTHAKRAMKDPAYLESLRSQLKDHKVDSSRINTIVDKIQGHMKKGEDEVEKGDIANVARGVALTAALATGAHHTGETPDKTPKSVKNKPAQYKEVPHHEKEIQWDERKGIDPKGKYRKPTLKERITRIKELKEKKIKKALTAGAGGAGSPMDLTGGGVMQSEALESGFKYITCKECGKEQVHARHQVKCRECGKNFSLRDLHDHIKG